MAIHWKRHLQSTWKNHRTKHNCNYNTSSWICLIKFFRRMASFKRSIQTARKNKVMTLERHLESSQDLDSGFLWQYSCSQILHLLCELAPALCNCTSSPTALSNFSLLRVFDKHLRSRWILALREFIAPTKKSPAGEAGGAIFPSRTRLCSNLHNSNKQRRMGSLAANKDVTIIEYWPLISTGFYSWATYSSKSVGSSIW